MRLALIYGGRSGEHDVSCRSARSILDHLDPRAYDVTELLIGRDGQWHVDGRPVPLTGALQAIRRAEVAFPALHGPYGEDGRLQGMLDWLGVAYVGNGVLASAAGMDKVVTKKLLAAEGLRVAAGVTADAADRTVRELGLPVFVKPARAGSSLGVSRVGDRSELPGALRHAGQYDHKVLIERAVTGREVDVALLQHPDGRVEAGPPLEITVRRGFFDHAAKYDGGATFHLPARLDAATTRLLQSRAVRAFHALGCRGLLRVDFFLPADGDPEPVVNEVNTFPGMTAASQYPRIWQRAGLAFPALLDILIAGAGQR
ncbi:D-alanine--D-alanine ligase family protein [Actinoplanes sp. URMC 104]|uniref:D-alanine--D-alanine ligase family protein n=1 Tax=Actinoplanes sp. URMC 104 TaxID=3423409 RepID=UPI003F1C33DC